MKRFFFLAVLTMISVILSSCGGGVTNFTCTDPLGCVAIGSNESIKIATLLTMSGPDQVYGIDAVRGVEIAITDNGNLLGHGIELVKEDDQCDATAGEQAAQRLAADKQIVGVIGATCSNASQPAAKILTEAGMVLISPSSTAPSLTDPASHQTGFLRVIYNDKAQGKAVAQFAFTILGLQRMLTIHDGTPYPKELQQAACDSLRQLGGECVLQMDLSQTPDLMAALQAAAAENPDVIYYPLYTEDGVAVTKAIFQVGLANAALLSSDGLLSTDFIQKAGPNTQGMYLSGPAEVAESEAFTQKYKARYGEGFIAAYHLQAYDASKMLFYGLQQSAVVVGDKLYIQRQRLRDALYKIHNMQGLSTVVNCSSNGDCAQPNIEIFQVVDQEFKPIFP
jgi:branched-chain amino acid transport system substrate-binding protein